MKPKAKILLLSFGILAVVLLICGIGLGLHWHKIVVFVTVTLKVNPEQLANREKFFNEEITIPAEWCIAEPYPADLTQLANNYHQAHKENMVGFDSFLNQPAPNKINIDEQIKHVVMERTLDELTLKLSEPYFENRETTINELKKIVDHPSYEMGVFTPPPSYTTRVAETCDLTFIFTLNKWLLLNAKINLQQGHESEAVESFRLGLQLIRRHEVEPYIIHLISIAVLEMSATQIGRFCDEVNDVAALYRLLDIMANDFKDNFLAWNSYTPEFVGIVGDLRLQLRQGLLDDIPQKGRRIDFYRKTLYYGPNEYSKLKPLQKKRIYIYENEMFSDWESLNASFLIRLKNQQSKYDLARLRILNRIRELEGKPPITKVGQLDSKKLNLKNDPFNTIPLSYSDTLKDFYSIGPDAIDDKGKLLYDPTNGTNSLGDIYLPK